MATVWIEAMLGVAVVMVALLLLLELVSVSAVVVLVFVDNEMSKLEEPKFCC